MRQRATSRGSASGSRGFVIASAADRARAFRAARRHTWLVRFLRVVIPLAAVGAMASFAVPLIVTSLLQSEGIEVQNIKIDTKNLVMEAPTYDGFGKDGMRYNVRAREAITDLKQTGPVRLNAIEGVMTEANGTVTNLTATWGTFDQKKDILELYENIDIVGSTGLKARLTRATVYTKESKVISPEPVVAENATSTIRARSMQLEQKKRIAAFKSDVHVTLKPQTKSGPVPAATATTKTRSPAAVPGLMANSGLPIEVTSDTLDVDDNVRTALFKTGVVARQGEAALEAPELKISYEGRATLDGGQQAGAAGAEQGRLRAVAARGGVTATQKDDRSTSETLDFDAQSERAVLSGNVILTSGAERRVTGDVAEFDQKADTALVTGAEVVATQGRNTLKGRRLFMDRKAGTTRLESPAGGGAAAGRIAAVFYQEETKAQGRSSQKPASGWATETTGLQFRTDPNAPIEIDAETLDVTESKKTAVFRGNVVAKQADFSVRTVELTAHYTGQAGLTSQETPLAGPKGQSGGAQLTRVEARQKVVVTSKDGREVTGDWADFDVKGNTITVGGKVAVADGKNIIDGPEGSRLVIDMATGQSRFDQPSTGAPTRGSTQPSISASPPATSSAPTGGTSDRPCPPGMVCSKGRFSVVLYPKEAAQTAKSKVDEVVGAGTAEQVGKEISKTVRKARNKPEPEAPAAWEATTSTGPGARP